MLLFAFLIKSSGAEVMEFKKSNTFQGLGTKKDLKYYI